MALNAVLATTLMAVWLWTAGASRAGACRSRPGGHARVGAPAARARLRRSAAVRPAGDLPRLPADRRARGRRLGDELRLRIPDRGRGRRHQRLVARARHRGAADPPGPGARGASRAMSRRRPGPHSSSWRRRRGSSRSPAREIAGRVLGGAYGDDVGTQIGRLVVAMAPYMVASVALSVTFPLVFVAGRGRRLPLVGLVVLAIHVPSRSPVRRSPGSTASRLRSPSRPRSRSAGCSTLPPRGPARRRSGWRSRWPSSRDARSRASCPPARCSARRGRWWSGSRCRPAALALVRPVGLRSAWHYLRELALTPPVTVVVLSWNGREDTLACLRSLAAATYPRLEVIVVDNGSSDGSPDAVAAEHPGRRARPAGRPIAGSPGA